MNIEKDKNDVEFNVRMDIYEFAFMNEVMRRVGGDPDNSVRKYSDRFLDATKKMFSDNPSSKFFKISVRTGIELSGMIRCEEHVIRFNELTIGQKFRIPDKTKYGIVFMKTQQVKFGSLDVNSIVVEYPKNTDLNILGTYYTIEDNEIVEII
tara:strand:+ start:1100 stop:1555 length:456 start_codon:yes stop_codon:yes gene_type:complete